MRQPSDPKKNKGPISDRLALKLIVRLGLSQADAQPGLPTLQRMSERARQMVHGIKPSSLGILISQCHGQAGSTSLYNVHGSTWLPRHSQSGRDVLRTTAAIAVVARALDLLPTIEAQSPTQALISRLESSRPPTTRARRRHGRGGGQPNGQPDART